MPRQKMIITRTSPFSGQVNNLEMNIDKADIERYNNGALLQDAFPYLSADECEFYKTGITPQEWKDTFGEEE